MSVTPESRHSQSRLAADRPAARRPSPACSPRPRSGLLAACADSGSDEKPAASNTGATKRHQPARRPRGRTPSTSSSSTAATATSTPRTSTSRCTRRRTRRPRSSTSPRQAISTVVQPRIAGGNAAGLRQQLRREVDGLRRAGRRRPAAGPDRAVRRAVGRRPGQEGPGHPGPRHRRHRHVQRQAVRRCTTSPPSSASGTRGKLFKDNGWTRAEDLGRVHRPLRQRSRPRASRPFGYAGATPPYYHAGTSSSPRPRRSAARTC